MKKNEFEVNVFVYLLINYMMIVLTNDYITYFANINYIVSMVISSVLIIICNILLRKKYKITNNINKTDIIFFAVLFAIMAMTIVYPDRGFDTINYHLYLQENPFGNKISFDFFAGKNLNSFTYAFPDRMFYLFRYLLGYRLGVILNYFIVVVMYYQVKRIVKAVSSKTNDLVVSIIAMLSVLTLSTIDIIDCYYVDLISIPLLLEIFIITMFYKVDEKKNNTLLFGFLGLLYGFSIVCKISNAFLLGLFFIIYIIKNRNIVKCLNIKNIIITLCCLCMPFILYLVYTYIQTGNPVFPFYNTIFKSKYYANSNWLDTRFGPARLLEVFTWPFVIWDYPERSCDIAIMEPIWTYGYIVCLYYFVVSGYNKFLKKKTIDKTKLLFFVGTFLSYIIWAKFQLGYSRYGLVVLVLGSIATYLFIEDIIKNKKYILLAISMPFLIYNFFYFAGNYMYSNQDWIYNNYYNYYDENHKTKENEDMETAHEYNKKNLFATGKEMHLDLEKGSVWGIFYCNAGFAQMVNNDIPIINVINGASNEYTTKLMNEKLDRASHIYTLVDSLDMDNFINAINTSKYKIIKAKKVFNSSILVRKSDSFIYVFEIEKTDKTNNNDYSICQSKEIDVQDRKTIELNIGIAKGLAYHYDKDLPLSIIGDKNGIEEVIDVVKIPHKGAMISLKYDVKEYEKIYLKSFDKNGNINLNNWFMIIDSIN